MNDENPPHRSTAIQEMLGLAERHDEFARHHAAKAARLRELVKALQHIQHVAQAASPPGVDGPLPYIGNGSGAEFALWELAINQNIGSP